LHGFQRCLTAGGFQYVRACALLQQAPDSGTDNGMVVDYQDPAHAV
jgi:hypothetical protein